MICVITNGTESMDFTKKVRPIAELLKSSNIVLRVLMIGMKDDSPGLSHFQSETRASNIEGFKKIESDYFPPNSNGDPDDLYMFAPYEDAVYFVSRPTVQPVRVIKSFTGKLHIGRADDDNYNPEDEEQKKKRIKLENTLSIPVVGYPCTKRAQVPSAKSIVIEPVTHDEEHDYQEKKLPVNFNRDYYVENPNEPDGKQYLNHKILASGYRFGSEVVTFSDDVKDIIKSYRMDNEADLAIYGFCDTKDVPRWYLMSSADYIINPPDSGQGDRLALSALIMTLQLKERVAIARYVNKNGYDPQMVILSPYVDVDFQALILNILPFAQDHRQYQFPSLLEIKSKSGKPLPKDNAQRKNREPTDEMNALMGTIIKKMDLDEADVDEDGDPCEYMHVDDVFNPILHRLKNAIKIAATTGEETFIPPIWPSLIKFSHPPDGTLDELQSKIEKLKELFDMQSVEKKKTSKQKAESEDEKSKRIGTETNIDLDALLADDSD